MTVPAGAVTVMGVVQYSNTFAAATSTATVTVTNPPLVYGYQTAPPTVVASNVALSGASLNLLPDSFVYLRRIRCGVRRSGSVLGVGGAGLVWAPPTTTHLAPLFLPSKRNRALVSSAGWFGWCAACGSECCGGPLHQSCRACGHGYP